ncbi:MAG: molybdate ABC transporter substrate-binding protein [Nitrospira sp.]|nr:molybdate ABC transporter substrate-binding protein [Nitrospira sp.]
MNPMLRSLLLIFALLGIPGRAQAPSPKALRVAAAASLHGALDEIAGDFERAHPGQKIQISYGASGSLTAQILQGAPFDLFLAADMDYPVKAANGREGMKVFAYARGRLVLWVKKDLGLDPARDGIALLKDARIARVALAQPKLAPYGAAAEASLRSAGLWEPLQPKLVFGGNIAQTAQYALVGSVDAAFIAASDARHPDLQAKGFEWFVPENLHPPLLQGGVVLNSDAEAFAAFVRSSEGRAVFLRSGFDAP